ncbi:LacI family DNA-binding transcriptional regulator [Rudaeicoccus suwonensis]|uniref:LacI family transcriptional regulator n=1 Tax=Rudaeicoccus suwonensis TaxID=657409 RepID=A0A561EBY7_9MICO|nr:LacI family DNA-binding transcriptional regulator [Rudaeicoccus suwonensis]TWE13117.1 LacI family transcriptional regulator [Rudaeicoccus suwonensis]
MPRPTIADIAREAGVSKGAVSFALNGQPGVSSETRARIVAIADRMHWRPHSAARALGRSNTQLAGLVTARPRRTLGVEPSFSQIFSGVQSRLSLEGIGLQLTIVEDLDSEIATYRDWAAEHRVDGVVLMDLTIADPRLDELQRLGLPAVALGGRSAGHSINAVTLDESAAMTSIIEYLAAIGHRRFHHISGPRQLHSTEDRVSALAAAGAALNLQTQVTATDGTGTDATRATRAALSSHDRPTALIFDNDIMAFAGLAVAVEMGAAVPGDVSIVSFEDSALAKLMHPGITALSRDSFALGEILADNLIKSIKHPEIHTQIAAPLPHLIVRESTAAIR